MENLQNSDLSELYSPQVVKRFIEIEKKVPGLIDLAINIKKLPKDYFEPGKNPSLKLRALLLEELRENTNRYKKGQIYLSRMRSFIRKANIRVQNALSKDNERRNVIESIVGANFICPKDKNKIIKILVK